MSLCVSQQANSIALKEMMTEKAKKCCDDYFHPNPCPKSPSISVRHRHRPSPAAAGHPVTNDDVLTEYLEHSLRVPDLILPDKVFPRQKFIENPPRIDFQTLNSEESCDSVSKIVDSITTIGCFQLVNYGIPSELIKYALAIAAGVFRVSPEKRATVTRSPEKPYGFEEVHGEEESEMSEEFVWCRDENLKLEMEGIWPLGYSKFSEEMETLLGDIEKLGEKILVSLRENFVRKSMHGDEIVEEHENVGMLIRGVDYSHALCLHICDGASEFHVYSKKGWVSFCPDKDAILITAGDQIQAVSGGQYKHVIGRPVYKEEKGDCISMAFLYAPQTIITNFTPNLEKEKTISLPQQFIVALLLTLLYHFLFFKDMGDLVSAGDSWPEFTLAELSGLSIEFAVQVQVQIKELESTYKELGEASLSQEFCQALATSFSFAASRAARPAIPWQQVQSWFLDKLKGSRTKVQPSSSKALSFFVNLSREIFPSIEPETSQKPKGLIICIIIIGKCCFRFIDLVELNLGNRISELKECQFEAKSAKDAAWYDVASFLTYRVTYAEDEWVKVKEGVRERSIPLEPSECHEVNVGDLVLCYQEREHQAVYCDAYVVEIQRQLHHDNNDIEACRCIFLVRYSHDYTEEAVDLGRLCRRPKH
ncbi:hypothetical protein Patl1_33995 [Pistacia atlantica]|uniref:Uncharacterized protein n=1 Tax=Pistacia atlantica TaxID=434234 RepID=A0ACC0ZS29_9ROSI|nr:hypothetical protein Patl1_33995 [Pistacia atlantica]